MRIEISPKARTDLIEIYAHGRLTFGARQAEDYLTRLQTSFAMLADFPRAGQEDASVDPMARRLQTSTHTIWYDLLDHEIRILRVLHHRMLPEDLF